MASFFYREYVADCDECSARQVFEDLFLAITPKGNEAFSRAGRKYLINEGWELPDGEGRTLCPRCDEYVRLQLYENNEDEEREG